MLATAKGISLIEQKRLQWAKEREEMVGLYGLWGRPRNLEENEKFPNNNKSNLLPPIERQKIAEPTKAEESETSGYLSDSPKHSKENDPNENQDCINESNEQQNETVSEEQQYWNEAESNSDNFWAEKKMYKNYKNENWAQQRADSYKQRRFYQTNKNYWQGTPESMSSDDGSRLRWGDRGLGIGHLWEPVVSHPESRLPLVGDPFRQTPKWVEKGLKNADGNQADILIIHHPDEAQYDSPQKNFLLGQNAPIPLEEIEERERKRKKALEHQNAIKRQLEEREMKRKQERENRIREEKLEEERIKKEQEIERLRYEEELRRMKQKQEIEKKKEEMMREAIKVAEKRAKEEKILSKRHQANSITQKNHVEFEKKPEKNIELAERNFNNKREIMKTPRYKKMEGEGDNMKKEQNEKRVRDSSSQFEEIQLTNNFQLLNMNGMPIDGGLTLMLDNPPKENFLFPPDGVQLALLMSPRNAASAGRLIPSSPLVSTMVKTGERTLTPSKYRITERQRFKPSNKSTQTDLKYTSAWMKTPRFGGKEKKQNWRSGVTSGSSGGSQKCNIERHHKHFRSFPFSKYRIKQHTSKINLEDRPKWGINRPSVQYKKQSEKDPYYQKKIKERLKKAEEMETLPPKKAEETESEKKEMSSVLTLVDCPSDDYEKTEIKDEAILRNGYRMNSNLSSPVFVPIGRTKWEESKKEDLDSDRSRSNDSEQFESQENDEVIEDEDVVPGSVGFLTQTQLEAIKQIRNLREKHIEIGVIVKMIKLDDFLTKKKEPAQVLDLSKVKITSLEEFKKYFEKIPECKVKPEKIAPDSVKIKDKEFSFFSGKKEEKQSREWSYIDPMPPDMKGVKLEDICPVNIDWKMLTTLRPKTKVEEDIFSRLVQLGKLDLKYQQALLREKNTCWIRKTKNPKSSIVEMRVLSCKECGEDFCDGSMCSKLMYDSFLRPQPVISAPSQSLLLAAESEEKKKKRKKKKGKRKVQKRKKKSRRRKLGKNSIFNRPVSLGCKRDHSRCRGEVKEKPRRALSSTRSFSTERTRTSLFERRSKSAPRIHFKCDLSESKPRRYDYISDSGPSQSDYSSRSDSQSPTSHRKFSPNLRLSGRRKLLSARVGFAGRNQSGRFAKGQPSHFVRRCTLYKGYRSDSTFPDSQDEEDTSESYTPRSRSLSKSPKKVSPVSCSSTRYPSTIQIHFDEEYQTPGLRFPEKMFLPNMITSSRNKSKKTHQIKNQYLVKIAESFSKIELGLNQESKGGVVLPQRASAGVCGHISRSQTANLSKFSGPYLKAKGLFEKKKE